jgi:O-antigen/teichoic acid export membrane protein
VSQGTGEIGIERKVLRRIASHPSVPAFLRELVASIEESSVAYRLAHGAFWSLAGTALSRLLALAASMVTARILGKAVYGEFGIVSSTVLTFQAFASLGLAITATRYVAELRATDPVRAGRILGLSRVLSTGAGLLATGLLWVFASWLATRTLGAPQLARPLRIAGIALLFTTMSSAQQGALAGFEAFRWITWLNVWSGLIGVPLAVVGVWLWGLDGAIWATVATAAVQWLLTGVAVRQRAAEDRIAVDLRGFWQEQSILWTFSLPALVQGIMVSPVTWAATAMLVNQPGGYLEMGAYSAANQWYSAVLFLPAALGAAVLPVLSERIGQADQAGARNVLRAAVAMNAIVVAPIVLVGSVASPWIMRMYGPSFAAAWPTLLVVLLTAGVVVVLNPVGNLLAASNRVWLGFWMNAGWAVVLLGTTVVLVRSGALGVALARLIAYGVHAIWTVWFAVAFLRPAPAARSAAP